jgi:hypothetical protein
VTVAALGIGGLATAAYAKALPAALQSFAHTTIGAPAARTAAPAATARTGRGPSPVGPRATGHAAYGLCTAWAHAKAHGTRKQKAVAFRNLAAAAGGAGKVAAYCATVPHPGASPSKKPHGNGKPTSHPTPHGNGKPTSHPTPHGNGKPTSHPTPHATGRPITLPGFRPATQAALRSLLTARSRRRWCSPR